MQVYKQGWVVVVVIIISLRQLSAPFSAPEAPVSTSTFSPCAQSHGFGAFPSCTSLRSKICKGPSHKPAYPCACTPWTTYCTGRSSGSKSYNSLLRSGLVLRGRTGTLESFSWMFASLFSWFLGFVCGLANLILPTNSEPKRQNYYL